ncbi:hypothetical protein WISP_21116 [Willisornis vidua]|uniref:Uncharacterized protein n=1 Tax=Willisornis vidua TaxID=1566151 RepID=A0ABQ9DU93_9PASS|nr:hypothetical protein WISP_21116 [Willisornis vidua]
MGFSGRHSAGGNAPSPALWDVGISSAPCPEQEEGYKTTRVKKGFSLVAAMAEYIPQPPSTWPAGPQPPHTSAICPLEPVDLGISEQQTPPEQPPSSPDLGEDEEVTSPPDPDVPYPDLAPVVFFCLKQTTSPRSWCIKMVCNPYPF